MARIKKREKRKIGNTDSESMAAAVRKVIDEAMSIRSTCKAYDIKFSTLRRYVKKANAAEDKELMTYAPNYNCPQFLLPMKRYFCRTTSSKQQKFNTD